MLMQARWGLIAGRGALDATPAGGASVAITQADHGEDTTNTNIYTFTSRALGAAQADRRIIVGASMRVAGTTTTLNSITVAGISATQVVSAPNTTGGNLTLTELWIADVPTGTTGNVVVTYSSAAVLRCGINVWRMVGAASGTASATGTSTVDPGTATITIPSNGSAVGYAACDMTGGAINWTNLTQTLAATVVEASTFQHGAASADFTTGGSTALTGDFTGTGVSSPSSCFATWSP